MENLNRLTRLLQRVTADVGLRACHISLYTALCQGWIENGCRNPFNISRRKIMKLARINSLATYHRIIHELINSKYIQYNPSYHPIKGSEVSLLDQVV
ncbi:MAG: hypothetical protein J0L67_21015 [Cytophagales bacterium]|jgi:hypothetical protein|nr:hypothetical protein [Cytophagales bacterium]